MQNPLLPFDFTITANGLRSNLNIPNFVCIILAHILPTEMASYLLLKTEFGSSQDKFISTYIFYQIRLIPAVTGIRNEQAIRPCSEAM